MRLTQGHIWKCGDTYVRIVHVERLTVDYKAMPSLDAKTGTHHQVSKKEFCRMLKGASLIAAELPPRTNRESPQPAPVKPAPQEDDATDSSLSS